MQSFEPVVIEELSNALTAGFGTCPPLPGTPGSGGPFVFTILETPGHQRCR
jgi:hypothetical protein